MRSVEEVQEVLSLVEQGLNDCEISRRTRIPRRTILGWRHGRVPRWAKTNAQYSCPECGHPRHEFLDLPTPEYPYLLGLYLGDGSIARFPRTYRLTIYLDRAYPGIVEECRAAMATVMAPRKASVFQRPDDETDEVHSYSRAWPCLFPQHGSGKKHLREIRLVDWQCEIVEPDPRPLLRGLIHSDGSRHFNTIKHPRKTYRYLRYEFTNLSADIKQIFCDACDLLGVRWRVMNTKTISVARRQSVDKLDEFIGPKH
jgi:hypothetical protein